MFLLPSFAEENEVYLDLGSTCITRDFNTGKINFENPETDSTEDGYDYLKPSDAFGSMWKMFKEDIFHNGEQ